MNKYDKLFLKQAMLGYKTLSGYMALRKKLRLYFVGNINSIRSSFFLMPILRAPLKTNLKKNKFNQYNLLTFNYKSIHFS